MPEYIESKSILTKMKDAPDPYFGITYSMNLYRGCQHQCIYCDSRSKVYNLGDLSQIRIKRNAIPLLEKALSRKLPKATIGTGSMNDPYMPVEKTELLTRKALEIIALRSFPVHVMTKSDLVVRDTELLSEIAKTYAAVSFTITTTDDDLAKTIEPGAPVSSARFSALKTLAKKGIYCGVIFTPVLPFINDTGENIEKMIKKAADSGASYILCWMGMTQREGQREYYYQKLDLLFPGLKEKYIRQFGNNYECASPKAESLYRMLTESAGKYKIPFSMNHFKYKENTQLKLF